MLIAQPLKAVAALVVRVATAGSALRLDLAGQGYDALCGSGG